MNNLHPYIPGEQPTDRAYVKLNANENPYKPCKAVIKSIRKFAKRTAERLSLYPDPDSTELKKAIADMLNKTGGVLCRTKINKKDCKPDKNDKIPFKITPDMIYCGNGSDEVLSFVFYAFFSSENQLVLPEFTYSFYPVYAGFYNIPTDIIPLNNDWTLNKQLILEKAAANNSGIIFANPNAPTSLALTRNEVRKMLEQSDKNKAFVVDEAYCDFGGESCIPLLTDFKNLIIVRTFSKSLCFAGMRLGYIVANPDVINAVTTVKNSLNHFPIDAIAQKAGIETCKNVYYYAECAKKIVKTRDDFIKFLEEKGWQVNKSTTNFIFARNPKIGGEKIYQNLKNHGILVRHFNTKGIEDYVRITIGTEQQMCKLKEAL